MADQPIEQEQIHLGYQGGGLSNMALQWTEPKKFGGDRDNRSVDGPDVRPEALITPYVHTWNADFKFSGLGDFYDTALLQGLDGDRSIGVPIAKSSVPENTAFISPGRRLDLLRLRTPFNDEPEDEAWRQEVEKQHFENLKRQFSPEVIGRLCKNTVLVGVVDTGIPLGHRRFRKKSGATRFLFAWQQSALYGHQTGSIFGSELYEGPVPGAEYFENYENPRFSINHLLNEHSVGGLLGPLDETSFNTATELADPKFSTGPSDLEFGVSHGAHVTDLAVGCDPTDDPLQLSDSARIIAVNLPPERHFGFGGAFLVHYADYAVRRILTVAKAAWEAQYPGEKGGFPLVINFSFGQQAGPKDGKSYWDRRTTALILERNKEIPTRLVMPAGNQNLTRSNARKRLEPMKKRPSAADMAKVKKHIYPVNEMTVPWRIQPGDQSHNFVEIWAKTQSRDRKKIIRFSDEAAVSDFKFWITPPGETDLGPIQFAETGTHVQLEKFARLYAFRPTEQERPNFVLAVAPSYYPNPDQPIAPAGLWTIRMEYTGKEFLQEIVFTVQTDQAGARGVKGGLISYFDHENYMPYLESGRLRDSYVDSEITGDCAPHGACELWSSQGPVQRKGTHNALVASGEGNGALVVIGGYRMSDGKPAVYSSTFDGDYRRESGREQPSVMYPSEESPSHSGILSAGSRDGSARTISGTSMATGLATRDIVTAMICEGKKLGPVASIGEDWIKCRSLKLHNVNGLKRGKGMVPFNQTGRLSRRESY